MFEGEGTAPGGAEFEWGVRGLGSWAEGSGWIAVGKVGREGLRAALRNAQERVSMQLG